MKQSKAAPNIFMDIIYEKREIKGLFAKLAHKRRVKKFKNTISTGSPSFGLLWKMAEFIKLSEIIFGYDNTHSLDSEHAIYSSKEYITGTNGFKLKTYSGDTIVIKLISDTEKVVLEFIRSKGHKLSTSFTFIRGNWETDPHPYDEMILEQVIKAINARVLDLFDWCYDMR